MTARIPASRTNPGFDVYGNPLLYPPRIGHNGAESTINFSPVDNSWPEQYSIPGADLPNYEFDDADPGDVTPKINRTREEGKFVVEEN